MCQYCYTVSKYALSKSPTFRSLDFVIDRHFMKLFKTSNMNTVRHCQQLFNFELHRVTVETETETDFIEHTVHIAALRG